MGLLPLKSTYAQAQFDAALAILYRYIYGQREYAQDMCLNESSGGSSMEALWC